MTQSQNQTAAAAANTFAVETWVSSWQGGGPASQEQMLDCEASFVPCQVARIIIACRCAAAVKLENPSIRDLATGTRAQVLFEGSVDSLLVTIKRLNHLAGKYPKGVINRKLAPALQSVYDAMTGDKSFVYDMALFLDTGKSTYGKQPLYKEVPDFLGSGLSSAVFVQALTRVSQDVFEEQATDLPFRSQFYRSQALSIAQWVAFIEMNALAIQASM